MKIVTLNLWHGGGPRIEKLAKFLTSTDADAVVCTEYRSTKAGEQLQTFLNDAGYCSFHESGEHGNENRVAIATRKRSGKIELQPKPVDAHRIVGCNSDGIVILGVYFNQDKAKATLFDYLLEDLPNLGNKKLIIGDFNTGRHYMDEMFKNKKTNELICADRFERLESDAGYVDLWRHKHGNEAWAYTWESGRGGKYRLDHAFGTKALAKHLISCTYDHTTREKDSNGFRLTDHSAMIVEITPPSG